MAGVEPISSKAATSLSSMIFEQLRLDIVEGKLEPGTKLGLEALRATYDIGMSPLREALLRLKAAGLVQATDQKGFRVAPVSLDDLEDLTQTRIWIETKALRASIERGDREWEANLLAALHRLGARPKQQVANPSLINSDWEVYHRQFHAALVAACGSPRLLEYRETLYDQSDRYRRLAVAYEPVHRDADGEHRELVDTVLRRDADGACALLANHFTRTSTIIRDHVERTKDSETLSKLVAGALTTGGQVATAADRG
jgi:DNA-binding GntR family transcriptional regulator